MNIEPLTINPSKFNSCKFRSEEPIVKTIKRCSCKGGNYTKLGYYCNKKQVFDVNEEFCKDCEEFESK